MLLDQDWHDIVVLEILLEGSGIHASMVEIFLVSLIVVACSRLLDF